MNRLEQDGPRSDIGSKYPHHGDLVPPLAGFDESVEEEMIEFLEERIRNLTDPEGPVVGHLAPTLLRHVAHSRVTTLALHQGSSLPTVPFACNSTPEPYDPIFLL